MSFVDNMLGETLHTDGELDEAAKLGAVGEIRASRLSASEEGRAGWR